MRIVLNGVETNNKGAELMLYAILQEIEKQDPSAIVFLPDTNIRQGYNYIKTNLDFRPLPNTKVCNLLKRFHVPGICRRLGIQTKVMSDFRIIKDIDYFIDGSGFYFSDKWNIDENSYDNWRYRLEGYKRQGTRIIFLPQAFGPCEKEMTKKALRLITSTGTLVYPREQVSYDYIVKAGCQTDNVKIMTDFTSLVKGNLPKQYNHLAGKVAIIPNLRMVDKGTIDIDTYLNMMSDIVKIIRSHNKDAYLLNHEGNEDELLCLHIKDFIGNIETVSNLNAFEVKGLISSAYMCITSRFHGLASALNSGVPCLATSWSHKYEELYKDYDLAGLVLDLKDFNKAKKQIISILDADTNANIRSKLNSSIPQIETSVRKMWEEIWNCQPSLK